MTSTKFKAERGGLWRLVAVGAFALAAAGLITFAIIASYNSGQEPKAFSKTDLDSASGQGSTTAPPWPLPADVSARVSAAGLNLGAMGMAEHYHAHLDILVNGQPVAISPNLGVEPSSGAMAAVHTHANDGVIHVEAGTKGQPYTLGQLFTEWNVRLTSDAIGSLASGNGNSFTTYVNGKKVDGNPALVRLSERQQIAIVYGPTNEQVKIPTSFNFDEGL